MKPKRLIVVRPRKDRGKWEVDHGNPPGSTYARTRRLFDTEEEALAYATLMAPRLGDAAPPVTDQTMTLGAAFERYFLARARKRSLDADRKLARHLLAEFGESTRLRDLTASRIARYQERRLAAGSVRNKTAEGKPRPLSSASINRPLSLLRSLLRLAHRNWDVLPRVPVITLEREPQGKIRWLTADEEVRLLAACAESQTAHLRDVIVLALETGMRLGEIAGLTWDRVDMSRGIIRLETTKSGRRREIPMRQVVYDLLARRPEPHAGRVWPKPSFRDAFVRAVERARLDAPFTFHSSRHHFGSWWMMRGGSLLTLSRVLGHSTLAMTMRYAHLSPDYVRAEMEKTEGPKTATLEPHAGTRTPEAAQVVERKGADELAAAGSTTGEAKLPPTA